MTRAPIWSVLAAAPARQLEERAAEALATIGDAPSSSLTVLPGRDRYAAVVTYDAMLTDLERDVAERLVETFDGPVYAARPADAVELGPEGDLVWHYERGRPVEELREDPFELAERLGCPLRPPEPALPVVRSLVVIEGVSPDAVRAALAKYPLLPVLELLPNRRGTLVHAPRGNSVSAVDVRTALPKATVYSVVSGPEPGRFGVHVGRGSKRVGAFEITGVRQPGVPVLDAIDGERTREGILAALDVPPELLGGRR